MYINDIIATFKDTDPNILLYADDTVIYCADESLDVIHEKIMAGMTKLETLCCGNKLSINASKTKYMLFKPRCAPTDISMISPIKIGNISLEEVLSYNYLGVVIDSKILFDKFLKDKCDKINLRLYQLGRMRKYITSAVANIIYKQAIVPLYDYADFIIESGPKVYIDRLNKLHEKALCIIDCNTNRKLSHEKLETLFGLWSPATRRHKHHCALMFRLSKRGDFLDTYRPKIHLRSRGKVKFRYRKRNLKSIEKGPLHRGMKLWDMIPQDVQKALTKVKFKRGLNMIRLE